MTKKIVSFFLVIVGVLLVIISLGLYFIPMVNLNTARGTVEIEHPRNYMESGIFAPKRYIQYELIPGDMTKTDVTYRVIVDNGLVRREDKVSWSALELGIRKSKVITHSLSADEYTAVSVLPQYKMMVYEVKPERDLSYLMIPVVYLGLLSLAIMSGVGRRQKQPVLETRVVEAEVVKESPHALMNGEQAKRCLECDSFKMVGSVLRCSRDTCKFQK